MLSELERRFLDAARVAHLATADEAGAPHVVPVCFAVHGDVVYITIDDKPKRGGRPLKRLRNIAVNSRVALVADYYDDADWSRLGWVMVRGRADVLTTGPEHASSTSAATRPLRPAYEHGHRPATRSSPSASSAPRAGATSAPRRSPIPSPPSRACRRWSRSRASCRTAPGGWPRTGCWPAACCRSTSCAPRPALFAPRCCPCTR